MPSGLGTLPSPSMMFPREGVKINADGVPVSVHRRIPRLDEETLKLVRPNVRYCFDILQDEDTAKAPLSLLLYHHTSEEEEKKRDGVVAEPSQTDSPHADALVVFFSGARGKASPPRYFNRWSWKYKNSVS